MRINRNLSKRDWRTSFLVYVVLLFAAFPQGAGADESSGAPMVLLGRLESTSIKYEGIGKATGASYKGTARVKVLEVLGGKNQQPSDIARERVIVLCVEERHQKPTWETMKGQSFVFVLEPIAGGSQFRVLDVGKADEATVRSLRESGQLSVEQLRKLLHPGDST